MNNKLFTLLLCLLCVAGGAKATTITAKWDWKNGTPASITSTHIEGIDASGTVASDVEGIKLSVLAAVEGTKIKLQYNSSGYAQFNEKTEIRVPVVSASDVVTVVSFPGQYNYTVGGNAATANSTTHTATSSEVSEGYVSIIATSTAYLYSIQVVQNEAEGGEEEEEDITALWDFKNVNPSSLSGLSIQNTTGSVASTVDGVNLYVDANSGKLAQRTSDAQFNAGTKLQVPVRRKGDEVTVVSYPGYHNYTIGGVAADADSEVYTATAADGTTGYVEIVATGNSYLYSIQVYQKKAVVSSTPELESFVANGTTYDNSIFEESGDDMVATIELAKSATMISESNPISSVEATVGEAGTVSYVTTGEGSNQTTVVTIPVTLDAVTVNYIATFVFKPIYTLTYYNTDGTSMGTQTVEKGDAIGSFSYNPSSATAAAGYTARGWFKSAAVGEKHKTTDVVTSDLSLYAVATETEESSDSKTYTFDLRNQYFYDEDHEAFNASAGTFHDNQHGWRFGNGNTIDLLVGAKAIISVSICQYSKDGATIQVKKGDTVLATLDGKTATDGSTVSYDYRGEAGTLTLQVVSTGTVYIHSIEIVNYNSAAFTKTGQWYVVEAGSADGFLKALAKANAANGSTGAERSYIYLPNGTYDLGTTALTQLSGHNISIMGESRDGVIIKNSPVKEGINITATLVNTGTNNFLQNLTLQCRAPYGTGDDTSSAERGVCLWDKGDRLICRNVYLQGLQDTYFSNYSTTGHQAYFEDSKIEGTVDFICGNGNVLFNRCELYVTDRSQNNGANVIVAPNTDAGDKGYLFTGCTINATSFQTGKYSLGRPWNNSPAATFIGTVMSANGSDAGWTQMTDGTALRFHEYATVSSTGTEVTTHNVTACAAATADKLYITANTAHDSYAYGPFLTDGWDPAAVAAELSAPDNTLGLAAPAAIEATISAAGYATFVPAAKVSVPAGVTAYIATASDASTVTLSPVSVIPAQEPVILKGSADTYTFSRTSVDADDIESNILKWSPAVLVSYDKAEYVLAQEAGVVGFHPVTSGSLIQPGKAYLTVGAGAREFLTFVEESTGVGATLNDNGEMTNDKPVYNLAGQRVSKPSKGIYIVGGKKVALR